MNIFEITWPSTKIVSWSRERNLEFVSLDKVLNDHKWPNFLILKLLVDRELYTSKWPKTAVAEIGSHDLICIQTSKWPKYFPFCFGPFWRFELHSSLKRRTRMDNFEFSTSVKWAILKFECISSHVVLSLSQQFGAIWGIPRSATRICGLL